MISLKDLLHDVEKTYTQVQQDFELALGKLVASVKDDQANEKIQELIASIKLRISYIRDEFLPSLKEHKPNE